MSHPIFMDLNPICCYVSPKIVIFHEPIIIGTCNKCHWIQHASNLKYAPLKQFQCIVPSQNQKCEIFCLKCETWNPVVLGCGMPQSHKYAPTQAISMHCSQSKSTKCEIFVWNCDFSWTTYCRDLQQVPLDLAYFKPYMCPTQAISMHFSQSKSTKCEILAVSWNGKKNFNLHKEKCLQICTIGYWVCHNALCYSVWQVLFELLWFFYICYGKVKI